MTVIASEAKQSSHLTLRPDFYSKNCHAEKYALALTPRLTVFPVPWYGFKMKNILCRFALIAGLAAALASCKTTYSLSVDASLPADKTATVQLSSRFEVTKWNNTDVKDVIYGDRARVNNRDETTLTVPAGNNSITFEVTFAGQSVLGQVASPKVHTLTIQHDFEAAKKYQIMAAPMTPVRDDTELFVQLYDATSGSAVLVREWKL